MRWVRKKGMKKKLMGIFLGAGILFVLGKALLLAWDSKIMEESFWLEGETRFFSHLWNLLYPVPAGEDGGEEGLPGKIAGQKRFAQAEEDPAYRTSKEVEAFFQEHRYLEIYGGEETDGLFGEGMEDWQEQAGVQKVSDEGSRVLSAEENQKEMGGQLLFYSLAQLEDYDFLMKHFYSVHTSTTADRELMDAKKFLSRDFRLENGQEGMDTGKAKEPQILIYHTHSQEAFSDSQEGETIVAVGEYLAQCLTERGFSVYHDSSEYDVREGELDRNKAYSYALEGLTEILKENPSIQVVIDLHRDGVGANTHLVTQLNGKPTAQIMFFNGMSQTPEGPIPYLKNEYREDNLAFSLQLQLKAAAWYPGLTRKIYLKGLRYNQHLRPRSCLVEVGAQTNTFQEAKNAMEPLADIFAMVLSGN